MTNEINKKDAINFPTKEFIRNSLKYLLSIDNLSLNLRSDWLGSQQNPNVEILSRNKNWLVKLLVKFAYENKDKIKATPIIRGLALRVQNTMLKTHHQNRAVIDLSPVFQLDTDQFIQNVYSRLLGRAPDAESLKAAKQSLLNGLSREAFIYMVCTSDEFSSRMQVMHLENYKKKYNRYILYNLFRKIPVFGKAMLIFEIPGKIKRFFNTVNIISAKIDSIQTQINLIENILGSLKPDLDLANQNILNINVKVDNLAIQMSNSFRKNKPVYYGFSGGVTAVQTDKFILGVPSDEWRLVSFLSAGGIMEPGTEKYFCSLLKSDMNVLDIGANIGIYTLHALNAGCNVYSYEPTPSVYKILKDNIGINGFEPTGRAHVFNFAVSDSEGEIEFNIFDASGHNSMFSNGSINNTDIVKVKTISLDKHLETLGRIDVVKIDVEGAEALVLQGMKRIITQNPDIKIILEFAPSNLIRAGLRPDNLIKDIHGLGFIIQAIDEASGDLFVITEEDLVNSYSINLLLQKSK